MLVQDINHGKRVIARLAKYPWIAFDTETESFLPFGKDDALVIGRARVLIWSACYLGESYSFPTSNFGSQFPTMHEWADLLRPLFANRAQAKAMHNANYDVNVLRTSVRLKVIRNLYDTMIGGWLANNSIGKGLKERAPLYGRHLRTTSTVNFAHLDELAEYAEQDVVQTDEMFQMQRFGKITRRGTITVLGPQGEEKVRPVLPPGVVKVPRESLPTFEKVFYFTQELPVLRATLRAEARGFPINLTLLRDIRSRLSKDRHTLMKKIFQWAGQEFNLNAGQQFVKVLHKLGVETPYLTEKGKPSVSAAALFKMQDCHEIVRDKLAYNKLEKMQSVYVGDPDKDGDLGLEHFASPVSSRIHCTLNTVGAVTGRMSASNPNLQQLPARQDLYGIRECFHAPRGYKLICLDYGQLEIRVMALFSQEPAMQKVLNNPEGDIHQTTADEFGVDRSPTAKQLNFLMLYGGGAYILGEKLTLEGVPTTPQQAESYVNRYNQIYPGVQQFRLQLLREHQANGYVRYWTGRTRTLDDVNWSSKQSIHKAETTLSNNIVQGTGQDFLKASIVRCDPCCINPDAVLPGRIALSPKHKALLADYARRVEKLRRTFRKAEAQWILQVHDEAIYFVREEAAHEVAQAIADVMTWKHFFPAPLPYSVPLTVEGGVGQTWKQAKGKTPEIEIHAGF